MEIKTEDINDQLRVARSNGENLAEMITLFAYFMQHTPEGRAVRQEIERDWQQTCARLRREKRLVGADFSCVQWLKEIQKELTMQKRAPRAEKKARQISKPTVKKKVLRFRGIDARA